MSLLAGTAASGSLRRPISRSRHQGNGSWRAGWLARPGPPSPRPLPWGGVRQGRDGGRGGKVRPTPAFPTQEARARVPSPLGALRAGVWGSPASSPGAHPRCYTGCPRSGTLFLQASLWQPSRVPSLPRAHSRRGRGTPPPTPRTWPPGLSPTWMYAIFARAHSLRPGHGAATATLPSPTGERGESKGGKEEKGSRVAPDVTGVADERRPPLCRPPRPCLPLRSGSWSRGRLPGWESSGAQGPRLGLPRGPALPPKRCPGWIKAGAPEEGARGSRGDCSDPGAGGAGDAGARARQRRGRGPGWGRGWEGAVRGSVHPVGTGAGTYREQGPRGSREAERARSSPPWSLELGGSSPTSPLPDQVGKTLFPPHPTRLELLR